MLQAIVGRRGKNLAVRFPGRIADEVGITDGERVEISAEDGAIVIRRAARVSPSRDICGKIRRGMASRI